MFHYQAFGRFLRSEVELADLPRESAGEADWILRVGQGARPEAVRLVVEHRIQGEVLRIWKTVEGTLLVHEPIGAFQITQDGRDIVWYPAATPVLEHLPALILGPVLGLSMHARGIPCLHGSAVKVGEDGVAFLGPKGYGKSTITAALVEVGAELITDDTLALSLGAIPHLLPGVHSVKLWRDSVERLDPRLPRDLGTGAKSTLRGFPARARRRHPTRFTAAYLLKPIEPDGETGVELEPLLPRDAALALVANSKVAPLLEPSESGLLLRAAAAIAERVPVYSIAVPHAWDRLPDLVATMLSRHATAGAVRTAGEGVG
jgi:hypothetical protein